MLTYFAVAMLGWNGGVRFFCGDETRIGLKTLGGRRITAKGVKPQGKVQWKFQATYLYGIVEPRTGDHFSLNSLTSTLIAFRSFSTWCPSSFPIASWLSNWTMARSTKLNACKCHRISSCCSNRRTVLKATLLIPNRLQNRKTVMLLLDSRRVRNIV